MARQMKDSGSEWIGKIPVNWGIHTASQLFSQVKNKNEGMQENNLLSLSYGRIIKKNINATEGLLPESFEGYNIIEPNDIVLRLTDLQNDHTSLRVGISGQRGIITSAYITLHNESDCVERYLYYQLHAFDICKGFYGMGAGVRQGLNWDGIKMLKLVRPAVAEQHRIAAFLDRQCAEIDAVIERTKATIEEYKKLKQAVIIEAVTKGVRGARKMKDSGIEWIGEIPEEWRITRVGRLCFVTKLAGFEFTDHMMQALTEEGDVPIVRAQHIKMGRFLDNPAEYISFAVSQKLSRCALDQRCLIITFIGAGIGEVALFDREQRYHLAPNVAKIVITQEMKKYLSEEYLLYFLMSSAGQEEVNKIKKATAQPSLSMETIRSIKVLIPESKEEQTEIVTYLDEECVAIDNLIAKKTALLTELET